MSKNKGHDPFTINIKIKKYIFAPNVHSRVFRLHVQCVLFQKLPFSLKRYLKWQILFKIVIYIILSGKSNSLWLSTSFWAMQIRRVGRREWSLNRYAGGQRGSFEISIYLDRAAIVLRRWSSVDFAISWSGASEYPVADFVVYRRFEDFRRFVSSVVVKLRAAAYLLEFNR